MSLSNEDKEIIFELTEKITGTCQSGNARRELVATNIKKRMFELGIEDLDQYLALIHEDQTEWNQFLSAITIHTTFWFREYPHFRLLMEFLEQRHQHPNSGKFKFYTT